MATRVKSGTTKWQKNAGEHSKTAVAGGSAAVGTHTHSLVQRAMRKLTGKSMKAVAPAKMRVITKLQKRDLISSGSADKSFSFHTTRESNANVAEAIRRDTRAMKLLKARAAKR